MCDNSTYNQSMFIMFHKKYDSASIYSVQHPIANEEYIELFLLYDLVHLLKNIRNNWCTEQTQQLRYMNPGTAIAAWKNLVSI